MRFALPVLALLVACSSEAPPVMPLDAAPDDAADSGPEVGPPADVPAIDAAPDAAADAVPEAAMDAAADQAAPPEASVPDAAMDSATKDVDPSACGDRSVACASNADCEMCAPALGLRWCCGVIGGRRSCAVPSGGWCPGVAYDASVPDDARYNCGSGVPPRCQTHNDCAVCLPSSSGYVWCCRSDFCRSTTDTTCR